MNFHRRNRVCLMNNNISFENMTYTILTGTAALMVLSNHIFSYASRETIYVN